MGILGILFFWIFYRAMTSERRSLARQRRVAERYEREAQKMWEHGAVIELSSHYWVSDVTNMFNKAARLDG